MNSLEQNQPFVIDGELSFSQTPEGVVVAEINNDVATATVALQGAQLLHFQQKDDPHPLIWVSEAGPAKPGKGARGGIPVCWPWFGTHAQAGYPAHGYVRTAEWKVTASASSKGATTIELQLIDQEKFQTLWPHHAELKLHITVGKQLKLQLTTTNLQQSPIEITEALHTYFQIGHIEKVSVSGLQGLNFYNKVADERGKLESDIHFDQEYDRVFFQHTGNCVIHDPELQRDIVIQKSGSHSTIVWNPWTEKAKSLGDITATGWQQMLCVESGNAMENTITLDAGENHTLEVCYHSNKTGAE